jgi:hypothetical protein
MESDRAGLTIEKPMDFEIAVVLDGKCFEPGTGQV